MLSNIAKTFFVSHEKKFISIGLKHVQLYSNWTMIKVRKKSQTDNIKEIKILIKDHMNAIITQCFQAIP